MGKGNNAQGKEKEEAEEDREGGAREASHAAEEEVTPTNCAP